MQVGHRQKAEVAEGEGGASDAASVQREMQERVARPRWEGEGRPVRLVGLYLQIMVPVRRGQHAGKHKVPAGQGKRYEGPYHQRGGHGFVTGGVIH